MRCLILRNGYSDIPSYDHQISRLRDELESRGISVDVILNRNFDSRISNGKAASFEGYDFCIYLDKDDYASRLLEATGIPIFNSPASIIDCDDKMLTYIRLSSAGIPVPDTTPGPLFYDPSMDVDERSLSVLEDRYGFPMVIKECYGSQGRNVYLAEDRSQLLSKLTELRGRKFLVQRFISGSKGTDMRVIVIGGRSIGAMIRQSDSDFRSNAALGGMTAQTDVPEISSDVAESAAKALGLDYCGVDLLKDENGDFSIVCEVNSNAFFEAFERTTGIDVAKIYVDHILEKILR